MWRRKDKKYAAKRKGINTSLVIDKKRKIDEVSLEKNSPGISFRLLSDSDEGETSRKVVCVSDDDRTGSPELGSGLSPSVPELDSIVMVRSQANLREVQETRSSEFVMKETLDLVSKPSGSKELSGDLSKSKPRFGMSSRTEKSSCSYPNIADSRNYTYDEMI